MRNVADENSNAQMLIRALKFSNAQWHIAQPVPVEGFRWDSRNRAVGGRPPVREVRRSGDRPTTWKRVLRKSSRKNQLTGAKSIDLLVIQRGLGGG